LAEEAARLAGTQIVGKTWQLLEMVGTPGASAPPPTPENYTITFAKDGTMAIQTDCNQASAEYTLGGGGAITITLATTTLAACPDGSIAEEFVQWLAAATTFQVGGEGLAILMDPESGVTGMAFVPVD
jgi:heat shock protein HslJ